MTRSGLTAGGRPQRCREIDTTVQPLCARLRRHIPGLLLAAATLGAALPGQAQERAPGAAPEATAQTPSPAEAPVVIAPAEPEGLAPVASFVVPDSADEIVVRGSRPGEIRKRLWDLDTDIERTVDDFYDMLNEIIVDEQFHVICEWGPTEISPGVISQIRRRYCYAGYQLEELRTKRDIEAAGGVYEPDQVWLRQKEQEYAEIVLTAIDSRPALVVAAENLLAMQEERKELTGGQPALSAAQEDRQRDREAVNSMFERQEARAKREAEREERREAERVAERAARAQRDTAQRGRR